VSGTGVKSGGGSEIESGGTTFGIPPTAELFNTPLGVGGAVEDLKSSLKEENGDQKTLRKNLKLS
jgi:hypothetical protein